MRVRLKQFCALAALALLCAAPAFPQASTGSVSGTVRDQSGAVIPNANIGLVNTATNVKSNTVSNESGYFTFLGLVPGPYQLEAEAPGMAKFEVRVTVQTQQNAVIDPLLKPGQVATTVVVQDVTPMVTTDSPTLGHTLERTRIEQLPINGRNFETLLQTVAGMEGQRAFGMRDGSIDITLDGAPLEDRVRARSQLRPPALESIQEFRVETNSSSAKYNRPTSVMLTSKSGTNGFHGSLFETNRDNSIGVARKRQDGNATPPQLIRNEFGGSAGGPLVIPKVYDGRNRTFWFFALENQRQVSGYTDSEALPTDAMWNGNFNGLTDANGRAITIYNPWTTNSSTYARQPFSYGGQLNVIDPSLITPIGKYLASITPRPTDPTVNPLVDVNWWGNVPAYNRNYSASFRLDHRFSDRDSFYARYSKGNYTDYDQGYYGVPLPSGEANGLLTTAPNQSLSASWVHTVSPTLFNELLASVSRELYFAGNKYQTNFDSMLGLPNPYDSISFPVINQVKFGTLTYQPTNYNGSYNTFYVIDDNVTKIHGKHEFQFGGHFRMDFVNLLPDQQATAGQVIPSVYPTALWDPKGSLKSPLAVSNTGNTFAGLITGLNSYMLRLNHGMFYGRTKEFAGYFQDNWRVSQHLTLNLGLRWDAWPAYKEKYGNIVSFDPNQKSIVLTQPLNNYYDMRATFPGIVNRMQALGVNFITADQAGISNRLMNSNWKDFGPRLGFAYKFDGGRPLTIRGGFRMSYFPIPMRTWTEYARSSIPFTAFPAWDMNDAAQSPDGYPNWTLRNLLPVRTSVNSQNVIDPFSSVAGITRGNNMNANFFDPNLPDSRVSDYNLTVEKEILPDIVGRAGFIGNHTDYLDEFYQMNNPPNDYIWYSTQGVAKPSGEYANLAMRPFDKTTYNQVLEYGKWGWSNANGIQLEMERRYSKGMAFQVTYVMMNAFTAGGKGYAAGGQIYQTDNYMPGIVPSDFDARNRFINYQRDVTIPHHRLRWNFLYDLPIGKGKLIAGNAGGFLDRVIGGWQLAGMGTLRSNFIALPSTMFATGTPVQQYGKGYPVQDCRSGGKCVNGYLWYNAYIPANQVNSVDASGKPNGIEGLPADYKPAVQPLNPWPANPSKSDPMYSYYGGNTTWVTMQNGSQQRTTYDPGDMPLRNQYIPGVRAFNLDASLFKNIPIKESVNLRFNADFFNVLNNPGDMQPNGLGIVDLRYSQNTPRTLQLSLRLMW